MTHKLTNLSDAHKIFSQRDLVTYNATKPPRMPNGHLSQHDLRAFIYATFVTTLLPLVVGKTVHTGDVRGHDPEVSDATGTIIGFDLLEEYESSIVVIIDIPDYGEARILLEELLDKLPMNG